MSTPAKTRRRSTKTRRDLTTVEHFQAFLTAADAVALELLITGGLVTEECDRVSYANAIEALAVTFCGPYDSTDIDDVIHFAEHDAKVEAAHMVGLARGLRLRGVDLGVVTGGAK